MPPCLRSVLAAWDRTSRTTPKPPGTTENRGVAGSIPALAISGGLTCCRGRGAVAYLWIHGGSTGAKKVGGTLERGWLYGPRAAGPVAETDGQGNVVSRFIYATSPTVPDYMVKSGTTYRLVKDQLGSPRLVVDAATGTVAQRLEYGPFGEVTSDSSPGFQPFGFAGGHYDSATNLVRFGARDYDAATGRWTARDPIGFAGGQANPYGYVLNDPVNLVDPSGLLFGGIGDAIGDVTGALGDAAEWAGNAALDVGQFALENKALLVAGACVIGGPACYAFAAGSFAIDGVSFTDSYLNDPCFDVASGIAHLGISAISNGSAAGLSAAWNAGRSAIGSPFGLPSEYVGVAAQAPGVSLDMTGSLIQQEYGP